MATAAEKEISQTLLEMSGAAFVCKREAGRLLGIRSKEKCAQFLSDVPCFKSGKHSVYFIKDLARKINSTRTYRPHGG